MSRIGNAPINIPAGVSVNFKDSTVSVEAKGKTLTQKVSDGINVEISENVITLTRSSNSKDQRAKKQPKESLEKYQQPFY